MTFRENADVTIWPSLVGRAFPPRDPSDHDEEEEDDDGEADEDHEPAVIREPDEDEQIGLMCMSSAQFLDAPAYREMLAINPRECRQFSQSRKPDRRDRSGWLAGVGGFEPRMAESKIVCLA